MDNKLHRAKPDVFVCVQLLRLKFARRCARAILFAAFFDVLSNAGAVAIARQLS
jgi:hypothetical protein